MDILIGIIMGVFMGMFFKIILRKIFKIIPIFERYKYNILCHNSTFDLIIKHDNVKEEIELNILSKLRNDGKQRTDYFNAKFSYNYYDKLIGQNKYIYEYLYFKHLPIRKDFFEYLNKKFIYKILKNKRKKENIDFNRLKDIDIDLIISDIIYNNLPIKNGQVVITTNESQLDELLKNNIKNITNIFF